MIFGYYLRHSSLPRPMAVVAAPRPRRGPAAAAPDRPPFAPSALVPAPPGAGASVSRWRAGQLASLEGPIGNLASFGIWYYRLGNHGVRDFPFGAFRGADRGLSKDTAISSFRNGTRQVSVGLR